MIVSYTGPSGSSGPAAGVASPTAEGDAGGVASPLASGPPSAIRLSSDPSWVGGNKHATLSARLVDDYENGIRNAAMTFAVIAGAGTITAIDSVTDSTGTARGDFLSPRSPEFGRVRASGSGLVAELDLQTAFVDPNAAGGLVTNYPNPFHPPGQGTTIAYQLSDHATVTLRMRSMRVIFDGAAPVSTRVRLRSSTTSPSRPRT